MDTIEIDETKYVVMKRVEYADVCQQFIDEGRDIERASAKSTESSGVRRRDGVDEHKHIGYDYWHPAARIHAMGDRCVMSDDTVVITAHSNRDNQLVLDMSFCGDYVKLVLCKRDAVKVCNVLQEFIGMQE